METHKHSYLIPDTTGNATTHIVVKNKPVLLKRVCFLSNFYKFIRIKRYINGIKHVQLSSITTNNLRLVPSGNEFFHLELFFVH